MTYRTAGRGPRQGALLLVLLQAAAVALLLQCTFAGEVPFPNATAPLLQEAGVMPANGTGPTPMNGGFGPGYGYERECYCANGYSKTNMLKPESSGNACTQGWSTTCTQIPDALPTQPHWGDPPPAAVEVCDVRTEKCPSGYYLAGRSATTRCGPANTDSYGVHYPPLMMRCKPIPLGGSASTAFDVCVDSLSSRALCPSGYMATKLFAAPDDCGGERVSELERYKARCVKQPTGDAGEQFTTCGMRLDYRTTDDCPPTHTVTKVVKGGANHAKCPNGDAVTCSRIGFATATYNTCDNGCKEGFFVSAMEKDVGTCSDRGLYSGALLTCKRLPKDPAPGFVLPSVCASDYSSAEDRCPKGYVASAKKTGNCQYQDQYGNINYSQYQCTYSRGVSTVEWCGTYCLSSFYVAKLEDGGNACPQRVTCKRLTNEVNEYRMCSDEFRYESPEQQAAASQLTPQAQWEAQPVSSNATPAATGSASNKTSSGGSSSTGEKPMSAFDDYYDSICAPGFAVKKYLASASACALDGYTQVTCSRVTSFSSSTVDLCNHRGYDTRPVEGWYPFKAVVNSPACRPLQYALRFKKIPQSGPFTQCVRYDYGIGLLCPPSYIAAKVQRAPECGGGQYKKMKVTCEPLGSPSSYTACGRHIGGCTPGYFSTAITDWPTQQEPHQDCSMYRQITCQRFDSSLASFSSCEDKCSSDAYASSPYDSYYLTGVRKARRCGDGYYLDPGSMEGGQLFTCTRLPSSISDGEQLPTPICGPFPLSDSACPRGYIVSKVLYVPTWGVQAPDVVCGGGLNVNQYDNTGFLYRMQCTRVTDRTDTYRTCQYCAEGFYASDRETDTDMCGRTSSYNFYGPNVDGTVHTCKRVLAGSTSSYSYCSRDVANLNSYMCSSPVYRS